MTHPTFIHDDFLLDNKAAQSFFHGFAEPCPIVDFHSHLPPADIATDRRFENLYEIWLAGDHYKWRAMRANGEPEEFCTGGASHWEKFLAFARTVPYTIRNPLHHWTHLELKRYFDIDWLLDESTAERTWDHANERLSSGEMSVWSLLKKFDVKMIGTTDDPTDDLEFHNHISDGPCPAKVLPSFRPDRAFRIDEPKSWNRWVDTLSTITALDGNNLSSFLAAMEARIRHFRDRGCLSSDHGLESCPETIASETEAVQIFLAVRNGQSVRRDQVQAWTGFLLCWLAERYCEASWVMQLHLGAVRNVNRRMFNQWGPDVGCDSIGDERQVKGLICVLGELSYRGKLPKTILYNIDPAQNYAVASMCGNFFEPGVRSKIQFGSGWWFLDQMEGMSWQLNALSNVGLLRNFVGMVTDSRSFMSFPRHEYFRRMLCRMLGQEMESGLIPHDETSIGHLLTALCHRNAEIFFGLNE